MFEELNERRKAVERNIAKGFGMDDADLDFEKALEDEFEKGRAKKTFAVGDTFTRHGITYKCTGISANTGRPTWSKVKDGEGGKQEQPEKKEGKIPEEDVKKFVKILKDVDAQRTDAFSYLVKMSEEQLVNFKKVADTFKNDTTFTDKKTRLNCANWSENVELELKERKKSPTERAMEDYLAGFNSEYKDLSKVSVRKTDKGNWDVSYDGHRLGYLQGSSLNEEKVDELGWYKHEDISNDDVNEKTEKFNSEQEKQYNIVTKQLTSAIKSGKVDNVTAVYFGLNLVESNLEDIHEKIKNEKNKKSKRFAKLKDDEEFFSAQKKGFETAIDDFEIPFDVNLEVADEMWTGKESKEYDKALQNGDSKTQKKLLLYAVAMAKEKGVDIARKKDNEVVKKLKSLGGYKQMILHGGGYDYCTVSKLSNGDYSLYGHKKQSGTPIFRTSSPEKMDEKIKELKLNVEGVESDLSLKNGL